MNNLNSKTELSFWQNYPQLQAELSQVRKLIQKQIKLGQTTLGQALNYNFRKSGKMLRPALILLFSKFGQKSAINRRRMLKIAAAIEMLHNATLIHDDIIDESNLRHGQKSIQAKFGKHIAVYAGDFLFAVSLSLLSDNARVMDSIKTNSKTMEEILQGEVEQYDHSYYLDISIADYLQQIKGKTAVLFGLAAFLGVFETGGGLLLSRRAKQFGEELGTAFQLRDDILDYTVSSQEFQKPVLLDVRDGVYSGPLIYALQADASGKLRQLVARGKELSNEQLRQIRQMVISLGGVQQAQQLAQQHSKKALALLQHHFPADNNRQLIQELTQRLLKRQY